MIKPTNCAVSIQWAEIFWGAKSVGRVEIVDWLVSWVLPAYVVRLCNSATMWRVAFSTIRSGSTLDRALQGLSKLNELEVSAIAPTIERSAGRKWAGIELPMSAGKGKTTSEQLMNWFLLKRRVQCPCHIWSSTKVSLASSGTGIDVFGTFRYLFHVIYIPPKPDIFTFNLNQICLRKICLLLRFLFRTRVNHDIFKNSQDKSHNEIP